MVKKISIIGTGAVGSTLAYHLISRLSLKELVLLDINGDLAKGIALDLEDTRGILNFNTKIKGTKNYKDIKDSDIVVFTAGVARKEGMTRADLLKINAKIAKEVSANIVKNAPYSIVIAVTNPLDFITYVFSKETNFARNRVIGMGSLLDTSRLMNILHNQTQVSTSSLEGYVFGLHSKDMIVSTDRLKAEGEPIDKFLSKEKKEKLSSRVQQRGAEIVGFLKNRSASFAPSLSCCKLIEAIAYNKSEILPVSLMLKGEFGLKDVCCGVPCIINRKGAEKIVETKLSSTENKQLEKVVEFFKQAKAEYKKL